MRMRKKRRLDARIEACSDLLIARGSPDPNLKKTEQEYRALVDYAQLFGRRAPVHLEVGCGNGGFVAEMARRFPEVDFVALEVCSNVILTAMERVKREGIPNVRFLNVPAEIVRCFLPEHSVERIYLNFSTPLPQKSREKQRLTSPRFLSIYRALLQQGGEIWQKTDSEEFFDYSLRMFAENGFACRDTARDLHHSGYAAENVVTEYERMFAEKGLPIFRTVAVLQS